MGRRKNEDREVTEAFLLFHDQFSGYIKEMDPELWRRAVDYAVSFSEGAVQYVDSDEQVSGATGA